MLQSKYKPTPTNTVRRMYDIRMFRIEPDEEYSGWYGVTFGNFVESKISDDLFSELEQIADECGGYGTGRHHYYFHTEAQRNLFYLRISHYGNNS